MNVLERVLLVTFALFALCALAEKYHGHQVISFQVHTENQARSLVAFIENNANFRLWTENVVVPGTVDIQVHPSMVRDLVSHASQLRVQHAILHKDLQKDIDELFEINARIQSASSSNFFDSYATYDQMQTFLQQLVQTYPTIAKLVNVGTTIEGREITGVVITGTGSSPKPQIVINGCQHAREWISPMTVAYLAQAFCQNYTTIAEVTGLVDNFEWTIIPIVNADGYVYTFTDDRMWRKNRRQNQHSTCYGVDINRNWNFEWGTGGSSSIACSETYMGPSGFSEPEETALANYISSLDNVVAYIDFHAYGELFMYPWGYTCSSWVSNNVTEDNCAKQFAAAVKSVHNQVFTVGPVCQTIYLASGGSNDWTYGAASVPYSFACELRGNSFILPPDQILPSGQEIFAGVQAMGEFIIKNPTGAPTFVK